MGKKARRRRRPSSKRPKSRGRKKPSPAHGTELVADPFFRQFNYRKCTPIQIRVLRRSISYWSNNGSDRSINPASTPYWRPLSTLAITKMAQFEPSSIVVPDLDLEQLSALGFLLASHRNVEGLVAQENKGDRGGNLFSKELDRLYERWFKSPSKHIHEQGRSGGLALLEYVVRWNDVYNSRYKPTSTVFLANDFWNGGIDSTMVQQLLALDDDQVFASSLWKDFVLLLKKYPDDWVLQQLLESMERYENTTRAKQAVKERWADSGVTGMIEPKGSMVGKVLSKSINDGREEMLRLFQTAESVTWGLSREEQTLFLTLQKWLTDRIAS